MIFNIINDNNLPLKIRNGYFSLRSTVFYDVAKTPKEYKPGELNDGYSTFDVVYRAASARNVSEAIDILKQMTGLHQAMSLVDVEGNIGFIAIGSYPKRKHKKFGNTISVGWTDENDWLGLVQPDEKPYIINPDKGFIVHANGAVSSENVLNPIAVHVPSSVRAFRITQLIENLIKEKPGKIEYQDMIDILSDRKDLFVEDKLKNLLTIITKYFDENPHNSTSVNNVITKLRNWNADFDLNFEEPTYFTLWEYHILNNIISDQLRFRDLKMKILSLIQSNSFIINLYDSVANDPNYNIKFWTQFNGTKVSSCPELFSKALIHAVEYLEPYKARDKVKWRSFHKSLYPNIPFSQTILKPIFERLVPDGGSWNTVHMCWFDYWDFEDNKFNWKVSANNKLIVEMNVNIAPKSSNQTIIYNDVHYSIESGASENVLSSYYFNMNKRHVRNNLYSLSEYILNHSKEDGDPNLIVRGKHSNKEHPDL